MPRATKPAQTPPAKAAQVAKTAKTAKTAKVGSTAKVGNTAKAAKASKGVAAGAAKPAPKKAAAKAVPAARTATRKTTAKDVKQPKQTAVRKPPAKKKAAVLDKFLQEQQALLLQERAEYVHQAETLKAEADQLAEEMEPGDIQFDEESGEGTTINIERERDLALSAQARAAVEEIDRALAKIDAGTYGICEKCGDPIPKPRLKALPYAALCVRCKSGGLARR
jgi:DnaK suppressor protein